MVRNPGVVPPRQDRSRKTLERIEAAALDLIAERGVAGASVQEIVDRAGSSVGSFYARFGSKDDLVRHLEGRVWESALRRWNEGIETGTWRNGTLPEVVEGLVRLLARLERADAEHRRAFGGAGGAADGRGADADGQAEAFRSRVVRDAADLLLARREEIGHADPRRAAEVLPRVLVGAVRELVAGPAGDPAEPELVRLGLAYLGSSAGEAEGRAAMDFFDVWG